MERDLNPREDIYPPNGLANRPLRPLEYPSSVVDPVGLEPTANRL
jgi:hypothetical protein